MSGHSNDTGALRVRSRAVRLIRSRGVTLMELLATVVIIAVLASVGVPTYRKGLEQTYYRESQNILLAIYSGERDYSFSIPDYNAPLNAGSPLADWREIHMDNPNLGSIPVDFSVASGSVTTFTVTATRQGGACNGKTITINQNRLITPANQKCWTGCGCD